MIILRGGIKQNQTRCSCGIEKGHSKDGKQEERSQQRVIFDQEDVSEHRGHAVVSPIENHPEKKSDAQIKDKQMSRYGEQHSCLTSLLVNSEVFIDIRYEKSTGKRKMTMALQNSHGSDRSGASAGVSLMQGLEKREKE